MDDDRQSMSPYSLVIVAALLASSQFWQPWAQHLFLEKTIAQPLEMMGEERLWEPVSSISQKNLIPSESSAEIKRLRAENEGLKKILTDAKIIKKNSGEDLRLLSVEVTGEMWRLGAEAAIINAGEDYNLKEGDWLLSKGYVCGKVMFVSLHVSLVSDLSAPDVKTFVKVNGIEGDVIWEGCGQGRGWVRARRENGVSLVGRQVHLSTPKSDMGSFLIGEIISERPDRRGGWMLLEVQGRQIPVRDNLFVMQRQESSAPDLFAQRDRLDELRREVRRLESNKLRMELVKP